MGSKGGRPNHGLPPRDHRLHLLQATQTWNIYFKGTTNGMKESKNNALYTTEEYEIL